MSKSHRSSHASEICRLEWRPSRLLGAALVLIGLLAAFAVLASEMPRNAAWPVALAAVLQGCWLARREQGRAAIAVAWDGHAGVVSIDGRAVADARLRWRGPLAFLRYRDEGGSARRLAWWPDTLPARQRRELRLAAGNAEAAPAATSVAP